MLYQQLPTPVQVELQVRRVVEPVCQEIHKILNVGRREALYGELN